MRMSRSAEPSISAAVRAGGVHAALLHAHLHSLHREHRLRYNQLFGVRINEYIMMLEADLVERLLTPLRRHRERGQGRDARALPRHDDRGGEASLSAASWRSTGPVPGALSRARALLLRPALAGRARCSAPSASLAGRLAFALWYLMAMEESSTALARDLAAIRRPRPWARWSRPSQRSTAST